MRSLRLGFTVISFAALSSVVVVSGCTASGDDASLGPGDLDPGRTVEPAEPTDKGGGFGGSSSGGGEMSSSSSGGSSSGGPRDGGPRDAGRDSGRDAGRDASASDGGRDAAVSITPGTKCPRLGDLFEEACGFCGIKQSLCDGTETDATWTEFGPCENEVTAADRCVPGVVSTAACGMCGEKTLVCQNDCHPAESACLREVAGGCIPGEIGFTTAACTTPGTFRERSCNDTCGWNPPAPLPCKAKDGDIVASSVVDGIVKGEGKLESTKVIGSLSGGTCGSEDVVVNDAEKVPFAYSVVKNPLPRKIKVEVLYETPTGGASIDTMTAAYPGKELPADRLACMSEVNDYCSDTLCDDNWSGLLGTSAVTIEANDYILVYTAGYSSRDVGPFKMLVRTKELL